MNLVTACSTMSAPLASGCCSSGVANVLSTTSRTRPASASPRRGRSAISMVGLVGDSTQTRSAPSAAASTSSVSAMSTRRTVQPDLAARVSIAAATPR